MQSSTATVILHSYVSSKMLLKRLRHSCLILSALRRCQFINSYSVQTIQKTMAEVAFKQGTEWFSFYNLLLESVPRYYYPVCSAMLYIHRLNCIDTIFQTYGEYPQSLKTGCLLDWSYYDISYIESTEQLRQSIGARGQLGDIEKVNGKQMAVLLFKPAEPVSAYTNRMRKICVKINCDTNLSWCHLFTSTAGRDFQHREQVEGLIVTGSILLN